MSQCQFVSVIICLWALPLHAAEPLEGMDDYVRAAMVEWQVPGVAIAVVKDGDVALSRGYGVTRANGGQPVSSQTAFPIASITKNFTATAIAILVEEGKIDWDDPVVRHLPELRFCDEYRTENTTIRDLVCHRTGLERGDLLPCRDDVSAEEIVRRVRYLQPASGFREKFTYNNLMYYVLGEVIARVSGESWDHFVQERMLVPLEMRSTSTSRRAAEGEPATIIHQWIDGDVRAVELSGAGLKYTSPAGSIRSISDNMAQWMLAALAADETDRRRRLLKFQSRREMQTIYTSIPVTWKQEGNPYAAQFYGTGLGWEVMDYRGRKLCFHSGSTGTVCAIMPREKLGVTILTTREWSQFPGMLMYDVLDAFLDGPDPSWDREHWPFWKKAGNDPDATRVKNLQEAEKERDANRQPDFELADFAGAYHSDLYGEVQIKKTENHLSLNYGKNPPRPLEHWSHNTFYVRHPVSSMPHDDWLLDFQIEGMSVSSLAIKRLGWPELMPTFARIDGSAGASRGS